MTMFVTVMSCRRLFDRPNGEWLVRRLTRSTCSVLLMWAVILNLSRRRPCGLHVILLVMALVNSRCLGRRTIQLMPCCRVVCLPWASV